MAKPFRAVALTMVLVLVTFSVLVYFAPRASAASKTWTTDTDFNAPGSIFVATEVVGTGTPARVDLIKSTIDWADRNPPAPTPGGLEGASMAFDEVANVAVLFGGYQGGSYSQKTWEYDFAANTWTEITTTPKPPDRQSAGLSYDPVEDVAVLFGGFNDTGFFSDTWEYDVATNTWSETTPATSPPQVADAPLVYFASQSRHLLVGQCLIGPCSGNIVTWAYDAGTNAWAQRNPSGTPSPRSGFGLAYHATFDRAVLYGGGLFVLYDQTFEYEWGADQWTQTASGNPPARAGHSMTYRPATSSVMVFGGATGTGPSQETWRYYQGAGRTWEMVPTPTRPPARTTAAMTFDTLNDVVVLYGGADASGGRFGDTWTLGAAYANGGSYTSPPFDSAGFTNWDEIWWNQSESLPLLLRFLIATSNDGASWTGFHGPAPSCSVSVYFETPPGAINCAIDDGKRYIKFLAQFGTFDTQQTPHMEDVSITYTIPPAPPCIVSTDPLTGTPEAFNVPVTKNPLVIQFSEAMDTATVYWRPIRGYIHPTNFTAEWISGNTILNLHHYLPIHSTNWDLRENDVYQIQFYGRDTAGNLLSGTCPGGSPGAPNPMTFVTERMNPTITDTTPYLGQPDVDVTLPIIVIFSEGMNTSNLAVSFRDGQAVTFTHQWSAGDTQVSLQHSTALANCDRYELQVNGTDKVNLPLVPGTVPNPWHFYTHCESPYIVATDPYNEELDVAVNAPIFIDFSEPMLRSSLVFTIVPDVSGKTFSWSASDTRLTVTHTQAFSPECEVYNVTVAATDLVGNPLVPNPIDPGITNPWAFQALCPNPIIMRTWPADGETDVAIMQQIIIAFNEEMNTGSVGVAVIGGPYTEMSRSWAANTVLTISHVGFQQCAQYTVTVGGSSLNGFPLVPGFVPNPWSFDIVCNSPYLVNTNPVPDEVLVGLGSQIWVNFSKAMDPSTVVWLVNNPVPTFTDTWLNGDTTLRLDHAAPLVDCFTYNITIDGYSQDGYSMITGPNAPGAPNPWEFTTRCAGFYIIRTTPAHNQQNVPWAQSIVVEFSEPADRAMFQFTLAPPGGISFTQAWSNGDSVVTLSHTTLFSECVLYQATVSARNLAGNPLINVTGSARNPWDFRTQCVPPEITLTSPADQDINVAITAPIVVDFTEPMRRTSMVVTLTPGAGLLTYTWSNGDRTLTVSHQFAFATLTQYTVLVQGTDLDNQPLVPGAVPNPWVFTTGSGPTAPGGLQVLRMFPNDLLVTWRDVPGSTSYAVYHAISKTATWPWSQIADVPTPGYLHPNTLQDGVTHCYIVRAKFGPIVESPNSTMGCKVPVSFTFSSTRSNVYWLSLPYRTIYRRASDISNELGPQNQKIDVIGKWDPVTQRTILWYYFRGQWRGTDFTIGPGDGVYVSVRSSFQWPINGTDGPVPRTFTLFPPPHANINWISLPFTSIYTRASTVVLGIEGGLGGGANTKIVEVAKWDGLTQTLLVFRWTPGGWTGTDFTIAPGEGIYLRVVSTFTWTPLLITPEVP